MAETEERKKYLIRINYLDSSCISAATSGDERAAVRSLEVKGSPEPYLEQLQGLGLKLDEGLNIDAKKGLISVVASLTDSQLDALKELPNFIGADNI